MPDKIAQKIETNGHAVPETPAEKAQGTTQRYIREAGSVNQDAIRMYNDLLATTTNAYVDTLGKTVRYSMELTTHAGHLTGQMMGIYRRAYTEGAKSWQTYLQDVNKIFSRPK